jgi:hypothetical protein
MFIRPMCVFRKPELRAGHFSEIRFRWFPKNDRKFRNRDRISGETLQETRKHYRFSFGFGFRKTHIGRINIWAVTYTYSIPIYLYIIYDIHRRDWWQVLWWVRGGGGVCRPIFVLLVLKSWCYNRWLACSFLAGFTNLQPPPPPAKAGFFPWMHAY